MSGFAADELQSAVFSKLSIDTALAMKINNIWDEADAGAPYPYITMGDSSIKDSSAKAESLSEHTFDIHIWSDAKGRMETKEIMTLAHSALHSQPLSLASQKLIYIYFIDAKDKRLVTGNSVIYHGTMRFKALISS